MANEPTAEQLLRPELLLATETPSWQLVCQLSEEVGFLRGALIALRYSVAEDFTPPICDALRDHDAMSAIRRTFSVTVDAKKRDEAGVLR